MRGQVAAPHALEHSGQRGIRQGPGAVSGTRQDQRARLTRCAQQHQSGRGQRHPVLLSSLATLRRHGPTTIGVVDLLLNHAADLARAGSRQDREHQRLGSHALAGRLDGRR